MPAFGVFYAVLQFQFFLSPRRQFERPAYSSVFLVEFSSRKFVGAYFDFLHSGYGYLIEEHETDGLFFVVAQADFPEPRAFLLVSEELFATEIFQFFAFYLHVLVASEGYVQRVGEPAGIEYSLAYEAVFVEDVGLAFEQIVFFPIAYIGQQKGVGVGFGYKKWRILWSISLWCLEIKKCSYETL